MKLIFFGTSFFASKILLKLVQKKMSLLAVVTQSDREHYGRRTIPPVKQAALEYLPDVPILQPLKASDAKFLEEMKRLEADFFVVVAYGQILNRPLLDLPKKAAINVHASLLPKYRGAAPMQRCLMNGEKETGVTIMKMTLQMDAGDILATSKIAVPEEMILGELEDRLCIEAKELLPEVLLHFEQFPLRAQDHSLATFAPKILVEECAIDWQKEADCLHNLIRAVSPHPGAYTWGWVGREKKRLKIFRTKVWPEIGRPGEILSFQKDRWVIGCGKNSLFIEEVQLEGKRRMSVEEFFSGYRESFSLCEN